MSKPGASANDPNDPAGGNTQFRRSLRVHISIVPLECVPLCASLPGFTQFQTLLHFGIPRAFFVYTFQVLQSWALPRPRVVDVSIPLFEGLALSIFIPYSWLQ